MAITDAQRRAHEKYIAKAYGSVSIRWPREFCDQVRAEAENQEETLAGYVRKAIESRMREDNGAEQDDTKKTPCIDTEP